MKPATLKRDDRFMLGLAVSALSLQPGETRTCREIAAFCKTSPQNVSLIEHRALRKIRAKLYCDGIRSRH